MGHSDRRKNRAILLLLFLALAATASASPETAPDASTTSPYIVIGFTGGFVRHDAIGHSAVQVAAHLRQEYPSGVHIEVFENRHRDDAHKLILQLLSAGRGKPTNEEKKKAHIIIYGHSWGASATVNLAHDLEKDGIPVLLTVQVDSVNKPGDNAVVIPANVAEAANFYQLDGMLHGAPEIRAADPKRTRILGNFRSSYKEGEIHCNQYPWWDWVFMKAHTEIECDPRVWTKVQALIESHLPPRYTTKQ